MVNEFYEFLKWYEKRRINNKKDIDKYFKEIKPILEFIGDTVIDLCCGTGVHSIPLAYIGKNVTGYDISKKAIEIARNTAKKFKVNAKFFVKDVRKIKEIKSDTIILMGNSIPHFSYKEFYEIIKKSRAKYFVVEYYDLLEGIYKFGTPKGDFWEENGDLFMSKFEYNKGEFLYIIIKVSKGVVLSKNSKIYPYTTKIVNDLFEMAGWKLKKRVKNKFYIDVYEKVK